MKLKKIVRLQTMVSIICLAFGALFLSSCSENNSGSQAQLVLNFGTTFSQYSISNRKNKVSVNDATITSVPISIYQDGLEIARADALSIEDEMIFTVPANVPLEVKGEVYSGDLLRFQGSTAIPPITPGTRVNASFLMQETGNDDEIQIDIGIGTKPATGQSIGKTILGDNKSVLFESSRVETVDGESKITSGIFIKDIETDKIINIYSDSEGVEANDVNSAPSADISADGRYAVFASTASNLVENDTNDVSDIFLKNTLTQEIKRINLGVDNQQLELASSDPSISDDGRYVAFRSESPLSPDTGIGLYLYDRFNNSYVYIADGNKPIISGNGNVVVFLRQADNGLSYFDNLQKVVFSISKTTETKQKEFFFDVNQSGKFIIFSPTDNLLGFRQYQVYLFNQDNQSAEIISANKDGNTLLIRSTEDLGASISNGGSHVAFSRNGIIYSKNITSDELLPVATGILPVMSADGSKIAYTNKSTGDLFVRDNPLFVLNDGKPLDLPATPSNIVLNNEAIQWDPVLDSNSYRIYFSELDNFVIENIVADPGIITHESTNNTFTPTNLKADTQYFFALTTINVAGESAFSAIHQYIDIDIDDDGILNNADNCPVDANPEQNDIDSDGIGDTCDTVDNRQDEDDDGAEDELDNCPKISNPNQQNTDSDALGDACDPDDDNDTVNDDADNCPLIANQNQVNTDNDTLGDACDPDKDNDGVLNNVDPAPLDPSIPAKFSTADLAIDSWLISIDSGEFEVIYTFDEAGTITYSDDPSFTSGSFAIDGNGDVTGFIFSDNSFQFEGTMLETKQSMSGGIVESQSVWAANRIETPLIADPPVSGVFKFEILDISQLSGSCSSTDSEGFVGDVFYTNVFINDSVAKFSTSNGLLNQIGVVNQDNSVTFIGGSDVNDPYEIRLKYNEALATYTTELFSTSNQCDYLTHHSGERINQFTGNEDFNGVYALEFEFSDGDLLQIPVSGATYLSLVDSKFEFIEINRDENSTYTYFPDTHAFHLIEFNEYLEDENNNQIDDFIREEFEFSGLILRHPNDQTGATIIFSATQKEYTYYDVSSAIGTPSVSDDIFLDGIGQHRTTSTFNRALRVATSNGGTRDVALIGLNHPPINGSTLNGDLYLEAYPGVDQFGPQICDPTKQQFEQQNRYFSIQWEPSARDITNQSFDHRPYSLVSCFVIEDQIISAGDIYTIVVKDDFNTFDKSDDLVIGTFQHTAIATNTNLPERINRREMSLNGAKSSRTEAGNVLPVKGFFNVNEDLNISLPNINGAKEYIAEVQEFNPFDNNIQNDSEKVRAFSNDPNVTLPSYHLKYNQAIAVRAMTRHIEETRINSNELIQENDLSNINFSRWIYLQRGLNGLVNVELKDGGGFTTAAQFDIRTNGDDFIRCTSSLEFETKDYVRCQDGSHSINYDNDTVTLELSLSPSFSDNQNQKLVLQFSDAINATATVFDDLDNQLLTGSAKVVTTELTSLTRVFANESTRTHMVLRNPPLNQGINSNAILSSTSGNVSLNSNNDLNLTLWDNNPTFGQILNFDNRLGSFIVYPLSDLNVQDTLTFFSANRGKGINGGGMDIVVGDGDYVVSINNSNNTRRFKTNYTYHDPFTLIPNFNTVKINGVQLTDVNSSVNPTSIALDNPLNFSVSWIHNTNTGFDSNKTLWQVLFRDVTEGTDKRSSYASINDPELSYNPSTGVFTWINPGLPILVEGHEYQVFVRSLTSASATDVNQIFTENVELNDLIQGQSERGKFYYDTGANNTQPNANALIGTWQSDCVPEIDDSFSLIYEMSFFNNNSGNFTGMFYSDLACTEVADVPTTSSEFSFTYQVGEPFTNGSGQDIIPLDVVTSELDPQTNQIVEQPPFYTIVHIDTNQQLFLGVESTNDSGILLDGSTPELREEQLETSIPLHYVTN